jgi:hypothetical protein
VATDSWSPIALSISIKSDTAMKIFPLLTKALSAFLLLGVSAMAHTTENPKYKVLAQYGELEIRCYQPMIQAVVHTANGSGFRPLAAYIFGGNQAGQNIAMTAPVASQKSHQGYATAFMMPSQYSMEDLPAPDNKGVQLVAMPARVMAVITFPGWANSEAVNRNNKALLSLIEEQGWVVQGEPIINQYNDPWTAAENRTNEVQYQIKDYANMVLPKSFGGGMEVTLY